MKRVCSFCRKSMGEKAPFKDKSVTHGICKECLAEQNRIIDENLPKVKP